MPKRKPRDPERSPDLPKDWIARHIERLQALCYHAPLPIGGWRFRRSRLLAAGQYQALDEDWAPIEVGETWGGPDTTVRFRTEFVVPQSHAGDDAFLDIDMDGGETQLSIDGRLWQGLDHFRSLVPLSGLAKPDATLSLAMEAFTINYPYDERRNDKRDYHNFARANLVLRDPEIEACFFDMSLVYEAYLHYWKREAETEIEGFLKRHLENACRLLGPGFESRDDARARAAAASQLLKDEVFDSGLFRSPGKISTHAHSHLDLVYLWPIKETFRKNGRTASNALSLLREYPEYRFSQSQPFLYEKLKERYPGLFTEVCEVIKAGRWEAVGATYVEPDGNLPGPESWVRQILFGKRFLREELGVDSRVCWLPDVFGVLYTLPQILKKAGVDYLMTAKLNIWNDTNDFPFDSFRWRGPDGSEVLAHFPPTHFAQDFSYSNLHRHWQDYGEKDDAGDSLYVYGWGDGGGGPTRRMVEYFRRAGGLPGLPDVVSSSAEAFFDRLAETGSALPVWDDELYMEGHRGTYTSRGKLKRNNRKAELLYRDVEILSSIASVFGGPRIQDRLNEGWKMVLLNQFHDTLPGTHVPEADADTDRDYREIFGIGFALRDELLDFLGSELAEAADLVVFNTLPRRETLVSVAGYEDVSAVQLSSGEIVAVQHDRGRLHFPATLPSLGWISATVLDDETPVAPDTATLDGDWVDTPWYRLRFDEAGRITSLHDKQNDREVLSEAGNDFQVFEDDPGKKFAAWDIAYHVEEYRHPVSVESPCELSTNGPLFAVFRCVLRVLDSIIEQDIVLYAHSPRIDFHTRIDWRNEKKLLKVAFPLNIRSRSATYDLPFGHIERPTHRNTGWEQARFEVSGHKWADMSEGDYGVALLNDCKYGYDARDNVLRLSLVRSPVHPFSGSDIEEHVISYALLPHKGGWRDASVDSEGYSFNCQPVVSQIVESPERGGAPSSYSLLELNSPSATVEVIKQAEHSDDLVVRVFDSHGTHGKVSLSFAEDVTSVEETNLLEEPVGAIDLADGVEVRFSPYEIKTLRVKLAGRTRH